PIVALRFLVGWAEIRRNLVFIYLSILSCALPSLFLSRFTYEFPSLIGGAVGLCLWVLFLKVQLGLRGTDARKEVEVAPTDAAKEVEVVPPPQYRERVLAFAPYLILIAVLVVTRVRFLPLRTWLNAESPALALDLGSLGTFSVSVALVFR